MKDKELNQLIGFNLRKLRIKSGLTQEQLADIVPISGTQVSKWEAGKKGIGKNALLKLCKIFNVKPYVFYIDEKAPCVINPREQEFVYKIREAEKLGVHDEIEQYCDFMVGRAKKKQKSDCQSGLTSIETTSAGGKRNILADRAVKGVGA